MSTVDAYRSEQPADESAALATSQRPSAVVRAYPYVQWLAPLEGDTLPPPGAYSEVLCRDISPAGFSYFSECEPNERRFVIALGQGGARISMHAEVADVAETDVDGKKMYVVGCRFTGRPVY